MESPTSPTTSLVGTSSPRSRVPLMTPSRHRVQSAIAEVKARQEARHKARQAMQKAKSRTEPLSHPRSPLSPKEQTRLTPKDSTTASPPMVPALETTTSSKAFTFTGESQASPEMVALAAVSTDEGEGPSPDPDTLAKVSRYIDSLNHQTNMNKQVSLAASSDEENDGLAVRQALSADTAALMGHYFEKQMSGDGGDVNSHDEKALLEIRSMMDQTDGQSVSTQDLDPETLRAIRSYIDNLVEKEQLQVPKVSFAEKGTLEELMPDDAEKEILVAVADEVAHTDTGTVYSVGAPVELMSNDTKEEKQADGLAVQTEAAKATELLSASCAKADLSYSFLLDKAKSPKSMALLRTDPPSSREATQGFSNSKKDPDLVSDALRICTSLELAEPGANEFTYEEGDQPRDPVGVNERLRPTSNRDSAAVAAAASPRLIKRVAKSLPKKASTSNVSHVIDFDDDTTQSSRSAGVDSMISSAEIVVPISSKKTGWMTTATEEERKKGEEEIIAKANETDPADLNESIEIDYMTTATEEEKKEDEEEIIPKANETDPADPNESIGIDYMITATEEEKKEDEEEIIPMANETDPADPNESIEIDYTNGLLLNPTGKAELLQLGEKKPRICTSDILLKFHRSLAVSQDNTAEEVEKFGQVVFYSFPFVRNGRSPTPVEMAYIRQEARRVNISMPIVDRFLKVAAAVEQPGYQQPSIEASSCKPLQSDEAVEAFIARLVKSKNTGGPIHNSQIDPPADKNDDETDLELASGKIAPSLASNDGPWWEAAARLAAFSSEQREAKISGNPVSFEEDFIYSGESEGTDANETDEKSLQPKKDVSVDDDINTFWKDRSQQQVKNGQSRRFQNRQKGYDAIPGLGVSFSAGGSRSFEGLEDRWIRKRSMATWTDKKTWLPPKNEKVIAVHGPEPIDGVAAAASLDRPRFRRNLRKDLPGTHQWRLPYKCRTTAHPGFENVDVYSLYESTDVADAQRHRLDHTAWENREVKQRFLYEQSIAFSRNWFGRFREMEGIRVRQPVARPKSMEMPMKVDEWSEEWYSKPWAAPLESNLSGDAASPSRKKGGGRRLGPYSEPDDETYESWEDVPECGTIKTVKLRIGERISRVTPDLTSSLRRSRWRKKHFPKGSFPY